LHLVAGNNIIAIIPEIVIYVDEFFTLFFLFLVFVKLLGLSFISFHFIFPSIVCLIFSFAFFLYTSRVLGLCHFFWFYP
jgi:hypothetical protein